MSTRLLRTKAFGITVWPSLSAEAPVLAAHDETIAEVQRFRGRVYVEEGAIPPSALDGTGRFVSDADWADRHALARGVQGALQGCIRFATHGSQFNFDGLRARQYLERMPAGIRSAYGDAIGEFTRSAVEQGLGFGEVGAWAVAREHRMSRDSILLPLSAWAFYELLGHSLVIAFATNRNSSATILKRLGGFDLTLAGRPLPEFFDPFYQCPLYLLGFDSRRPAPAYAATVAMIKERLLEQASPAVGD